MKRTIFQIFSGIVIISFVGFIVFIHLNSLRPSFSTLKDNSINSLEEGEILYYGSSSCEVCQEFNKILKEFQDETHTKIYYWDATNLNTVKKAAEVKVYNTPSIIIIVNNKIKIAQGYQNLEELKQFVEGD
ncbi:conjugal transfer protein TraF [Streptococcus sciuri]|uniref:Thioredoxin family protein n=1 Tax=Streptococcus sciuri TaxID=2973939 RepID=A0ABT2F4V7_9STRE|nr:conjugal transfer protein TraF [Streptococcus sciuri]MCS4487504.1 thioredoxin family protein [Streptococcus sciuri]